MKTTLNELLGKGRSLASARIQVASEYESFSFAVASISAEESAPVTLNPRWVAMGREKRPVPQPRSSTLAPFEAFDRFAIRSSHMVAFCTESERPLS